MAGNASTYRYKVELTYQGGSEDTYIYAEQIKQIIIDHNYEENCMPVIYAIFNADRKVVDDMIKNQNNAYMILHISAFNNGTLFESETDAINVKCTYFINDDVNKTDPIDYTSATGIEKMQGNTFSLVKMGLVCIDHVKNNKKNCALVMKEAKAMDVVKQITSHIDNMVIEDFEYNDEYEQLIIPAVSADTVSSTLEFLNNKRVFYSTPYRFYQDFNATYLISSSGKPVSGGKSNGFGGGGGAKLLGGSTSSLFGGTSDEITIQISDIDDMTTALSGIVINILSGLLGLGGSFGLGGSSGGDMQIGLNYGNIQVIDTTITNKRKSKLRTTSSDGTSENDFAVTSELLPDAPKSKRMNNDNEHMAENIKADVDSQNYLLAFKKEDLDTNMFTINKSITINNTQRYQDLNGKYLLYRKRETYTRDSNTFILESFINLRRIDSGGDSNHKSGSGSFFSFK